MKKTIAALGFVTAMALSSTAMATQWIDSVANSVTLNNGHPDYTFTYDLTGDGSPQNVLSDPTNPFHPKTDVISSAALLLNFTANGTTTKTANIKIDGLAIQNNFTIVDETIGLLTTAIAQLNDNGTLDLSVHRVNGTFDLTSSILTADGTDNTIPPPPGPDPVPEPGTVMLMGAGFVGLAIYGKRRRNA